MSATKTKGQLDLKAALNRRVSVTQGGERIRPLIEPDIPEVVDLFVRVYEGTPTASKARLHRLFTTIFFENPWYEANLPSLVYQDIDGKIIGFLGVVPRRMHVDGRTIQAAVSCHFVVEPTRRSSPAGIQLLGRFLSGPQDLSLADSAGDVSRRIWERLGGSTSLLHSMYWTRPLRLSSYLLSRLCSRNPRQYLLRAAAPLCELIDRVVGKIPKSPFYRPHSVREDELTFEVFRSSVADVWRGNALRPEYDELTWNWVLKVATEKKIGTLKKLVVRDQERQLLGWYIYFMNPGGSSEVAQIAARPGAMPAVLDHLICHASLNDVVALSGRMEPIFAREFAERFFLIHRVAPWTLVHSRNPQLVDTVIRGQAFLSRLEGEWWLIPEVVSQPG
jgi:hypothetical protein